MQRQIPTRSDPWVGWARVLLILIVAATVAALSGCARDDTAPAPLPTPGIPGSPAKTALPPVLYVDNETGCHYLGTGDPAAPLVPRMARDGKQVCK